MKKFLKTKNSNLPLVYGYDFNDKIVKNGYHSGGAGYVLSYEAFRRIGSVLLTNYSFCPNSGTEDVDCGSCLNSLGVENGKSTDLFGKERFLPSNIVDFVYGKNIDWVYSMAKNLVPNKVTI